MFDEDFFEGLDINDFEFNNEINNIDNKENSTVVNSDSNVNTKPTTVEFQPKTEESNSVTSNVNNPIVTNDINQPFIPTSNTEYIEKVKVKLSDQDETEVEIKIPGKPNIKFQQEMWDDIDKFEKESWTTNNQGFKTGFKCLDKAFDGGIKNGFYIIAGDSNIGKSAIMSQLAYQIALNNDNAFVMDFSLDDPKEDKIPRILGSTFGIILNAFSQPLRYKQYPEMILRRKKALLNLRSNADRYKLYDSSDMNCIEDIEEEIKRISIELKANNINKKIIVFIDNFHDLNLKGQDPIEKIKYSKLAEKVSDMAIKWKIPIICTAEFRKLTDPKRRRPEIDDIREAVKIKYEAKAILLLYNEVHYNGENAEMYFNRSNMQEKQPVIECRFAKNKISGYKGTLFFEFFPEMAKVMEASQSSETIYKNILYKS